MQVLLMISGFRCFLYVVDCVSVFFFFNDTATTEIYTLSLHDALPIFACHRIKQLGPARESRCGENQRSEEHTSELQSRLHLVCRLLLEKKKKITLSNSTYRQKKNNNTLEQHR